MSAGLTLEQPHRFTVTWKCTHVGWTELPAATSRCCQMKVRACWFWPRDMQRLLIYSWESLIWLPRCDMLKCSLITVTTTYARSKTQDCSELVNCCCDTITKVLKPDKVSDVQTFWYVILLFLLLVFRRFGPWQQEAASAASAANCTEGWRPHLWRCRLRVQCWTAIEVCSVLNKKWNFGFCSCRGTYSRQHDGNMTLPIVGKTGKMSTFFGNVSTQIVLWVSYQCEETLEQVLVFHVRWQKATANNNWWAPARFLQTWCIILSELAHPRSQPPPKRHVRLEDHSCHAQGAALQLKLGVKVGANDVLYVLWES